VLFEQRPRRRARQGGGRTGGVRACVVDVLKTAAK
jgi:hypothetical protein